jgi:hypothetical protein
MATTTTNYGFDVPTSSDLVKNGATQIALLGQDLDTFLFRPFTRNGVLNSSFNVWQRGTSFTATSVYTADRWYKAGNTPHTFSRQATNDTTNLPNIQYCLRAQRDSGSSATGLVQLANMFETVNSIPYAGKTVTFSFYARAGANYSPTSSALSAQVRTGTGTDQNLFSGYTGSATPITVAATLTTTWQRFSGTATLSSSATEMCVYFEALPTGTAGANDYFEVTGVQIEVGNQASPYAPATPTYATELAACQRYYYRNTSGSLYGLMVNAGYFSSTTAYYPSVQFPVPMRIAPTSVDFSTLTAQDQAGATYAMSALSIDTATVTPFGTSVNSTVSGATAGRYGRVLANNSTTAFLGFSAEL